MSFFDFLFPKQCVSCGKLGDYLCASCLDKVHSLRKKICPVCQKASIIGNTHPKCRSKTQLDGLISVLPYYGVSKQLIRQLKFKMVRELYLIIVELCVSLGNLELLAKKDWLLLPVPLHKQRQNWRGFNQASLLADSLADYFSLSCHSKLLKRVVNTREQALLSGEDRRNNLAGAFQVDPKFRKDLETKQHIMLVDDVFTTGSTLQACAKTLKKAGAKNVWAFTVARTV